MPLPVMLASAPCPALAPSASLPVPVVSVESWPTLSVSIEPLLMSLHLMQAFEKET